MQVKVVMKEGLGRRGCLSSVGYELYRTMEEKPAWWASFTYATNDPDGLVLALRRLSTQLEERLDELSLGETAKSGEDMPDD